MPGFQEEIIEDRPDHIWDLWPTPSSDTYWERLEETAIDPSGREKHPDCVLAEQMDLWASEEERKALLQDKDKLLQLTTALAVAIRMPIHTFQALQQCSKDQWEGQIFLAVCKGCNRRLDIQSGKVDGPEKSKTQDFPPKLSSLVHLLITTMGVVNHLLLRKKDCDLLVLLLTRQPPPGMSLQEWRMVEPEDQRPFLVERLAELVSACGQHLPRLAYAAITILSLLTARRPAATFALVPNPEDLANCCIHYVQERVLNDLQPETDLVKSKLLGAVALVRILPLLYHLGSWQCTHSTLQDKMAPLLAQIVSILAQDRASVEDCYDFSARALLDPLIPRLEHMPIGMFAIAAVLEVLARWSENGVGLKNATSLLEGCSEQIKAFQEEFEDEEFQVNFLSDLLDGVGACSQDQCAEVLRKNDSELLLRCPLLQAKMRCGLVECRAKPDHPDSKFLQCSGGCKGLEVYCCRDHQKEHWESHKTFCLAASEK